jgi:SAM-dependent methyltransferase
MTKLDEYSVEEIEKWDREWLSYLLAEYPKQLASFRSYPAKPQLPKKPEDLINFSLGKGHRFYTYCHREAISRKKVMELGCGAGNLGKYLARYCKSYLGVDGSRIALAVAKLVSPNNCTYLHVNEHQELGKYFGKIDTVISRFFWIHQNMDSARKALRFLGFFIKPRGRIYMDFFMKCPQEAEGHWKNAWITLSPSDPLPEAASTTYEFTLEDIHSLINEFGFKIIHQYPDGKTQRRYIVIER